MSTIRVPPSPVTRTTSTRQFGANLPDRGHIGSERVRRRNAASAASRFGRRDHGNELAFVGDVGADRSPRSSQVLQATRRLERGAGPPRARPSGSCHARARCTRLPAPPRVGPHGATNGSTAHVEQHLERGREEVGGNGRDFGLECEVARGRASTAMPWSAMVPDTITTSSGRTFAASRTRPGGTIPMPEVEMYMPSAAPRSDNLGVAGDDVDTGDGRPRPPCRQRFRAKDSIGNPSSRTNAADECEGTSAHHRPGR